MQSIGTRLNSDTYQKVEDRCRGSGCSKSEYIKRLIANDLNGKVPLSSEIIPKVKSKIIIRKPVTLDAHQEAEQPKPEPPKEDPHITLGKRLPRGVNFAECRGCHTVIQNPHVTTRFKACPQCSANTVPRDNTICPTCGKHSESDEWDDSDVELEEEW